MACFSPAIEKLFSHSQSYLDTGKTIKSSSPFESVFFFRVATLLLGILSDSHVLGKLTVSVTVHIFLLQYLPLEVLFYPGRNMGKGKSFLSLFLNKIIIGYPMHTILVIFSF